MPSTLELQSTGKFSVLGAAGDGVNPPYSKTTMGVTVTTGETTKSTATKATATKPSYDRWEPLVTPIDYGLCSPKTHPPGDTNTNTNTGGHYITTAINYTNGPAHIGHAYEGITADALARYYRSKRSDETCYFVTGSDEHGQKIAATAEKEHSQPIDICNKYVGGFKCLNQRTLVSNNDYVRTTSERHKRTARALWNKCHDANDIYLSTYSGWYNIREETFVTETEAEQNDYKDPASGLPLKKVEEESYFFKMSEYHDRLVQYITDNPGFIQPNQHRNAILSRLNSDKLRDLSISRTTFDWGISVPEGFKKGHVMYVWFDALSNYLTGVDALNVNKEGRFEQTNQYWPANVHIIGKDILWFHTVIWPCILMSAKLPLPQTVFAHGFVNDKQGKKMSKSFGNVINPHDLLDIYSVDAVRWYICREAPYGGDLSFSESNLMDMHNSELCDTLGNLIHRATNLCTKYCEGIVPDVPHPDDSPINFGNFRSEFVTKMDGFELEGAGGLIMQGYRDINGWLTEKEPWKKKGDEFNEFRQVVVRATLEACYAMAHFLLPFIPNGVKMIFDKLGTPPKALLDLDTNLRNLRVGTKVNVGEVLFQKIVSEDELNAAEAAKKKAVDYATAQKLKKEKKAKESAKSKAGQKSGASTPNQPNFTKMDIRVGVIKRVWNHPEAEKLYCEEIDCGDEDGKATREVASGLRDFYSLKDMENRKVLVVCNLKPSKLIGFASNGMVLAAKEGNGGKVELISPPENAKIGERVFVEGVSGEPLSSAQIKKKKVWDTVAKCLKTGEGGIAMWEEKAIMTTAGACSATSLVGAPIS